MDCEGICFGNAFLDDCQQCSGGTTNHIENSDMDCEGICFGNAFLDDCGECNNQNQSCLDEIFMYMPYNFYALIQTDTILLSWEFEPDIQNSFIQGFNIYHGENELEINQIGTTQMTYYETNQFNGGIFCVSIFDQYNNESDLVCSNASEYYSFFYSFHEGANLISFPYIPEDNSVASIFESIKLYLDGIIGEGVAAYYNETIDQWVGNLNDINYLNGYWVKIDINLEQENIDFSMLGFPYQGNLIYELHEGYNLISYIGQDNISIEDGIPNEFLDNITSIIGEGMASVYNQTLNQWLGNLDYLEYGTGYWVEVNEPVTFYWNNPESSFIIKKNN